MPTTPSCRSRRGGRAIRSRDASVGTDTGYLPMIMDSSTRTSLVTYTKYQEEVTRKKISGTAMMYGLEIEPGDLWRSPAGRRFRERDVQGHRDAARRQLRRRVHRRVDPELRVAGGPDPYWIYVVLLMGFEGSTVRQGHRG